VNAVAPYEAKWKLERKQKRIYKPQDFRFSANRIPTTNGQNFCIVPEVAPILEKLCRQAAAEAVAWPTQPNAIPGTGILGARAAVILKANEEGVVRRLHAVLHRKQLFINAPFIEACLAAMEEEHNVRYGEWPSSYKDALDSVTFAAEIRGKKVKPGRLAFRARKLHRKAIRKAYRHACEIDVGRKTD
jgi:hypothetical protein